MYQKKIKLAARRRLIGKTVAYIVGINGLLIIAGGLSRDLRIRDTSTIPELSFDIDLVFGITLIYLSSLLMRYKRTAWGATVVVYIFMLGINLDELFLRNGIRHHYVSKLSIIQLLVPILMTIILLLNRDDYKTKSDLKSFGSSVRFTLMILLVAFCYGTLGFMLMDNRDFHREISLLSAMHYTIDQFGLSTSVQLFAYTRRAHYFLDSLNVISIASLAYVGISLFQPIRVRLGEHLSEDREKIKNILVTGGGSSEDIFKIWPHDKLYLFNATESAAIAYKVQNGIALSVGDVVGKLDQLKSAMRHFEEVCLVNDWLPAFIHTEPKHTKLYEDFGYSVQKIGQEPLVDISQFCEVTAKNKYFRNIQNRFEKLNFSTDVYSPPHSEALLSRLGEISSDWLKLPGRAERGFVMGYFSHDYMQHSNILVARDDAGTIRAFINQVESFDPETANFDLLRYAQGSPGNINDFVLMKFIEHLRKNSTFTKLNLGLCPLTGLDEADDKKSLVSSLLKFVYSNGDRFYSFSGLYRFKAKYEPIWSDRYVVYKGGVRGFTRTMNALLRAMSLKNMPRLNIFNRNDNS